MTQTPNLERDTERDAESLVEPAPAKARPGRRSLVGARLIVGTLAVLLLTPTMLSIRGGDEAVENRVPVPFPEIAPATVLDTETYRQVDAALRDRLTLRRFVIKAVGKAGYDGLGYSFNTNAYIGEDRTPFLADDFTKPCNTPFDAAAVDARLRSLEQTARQAGKDVLFVIAPDKSSVLRHKLGPMADALMVCADPVREQSQARWGDDPTGPVVTLWPQFAAAERAEPGRVWQHGDSHWSYQGAMMFTREVIDRLVARGEAPEQLRGAPGAEQRPDRSLEGDLYRLMGIPRKEKVANWVVRREGVTVDTSTLPTVTGRGLRTRTTSAPAGTPMVPGRTLVVYDSFFYVAELQMAPYFAEMSALHWDDFLPMAREGRIPDFDRVIFQSVQRSWPQRSVDQLPDPTVTATLDAALRRPTATP
ncbi:alginate O-acetyltransferase AlgX-related protein [Solwaraspora sp. WMMB335]|uniref:alginate O-acetyltransferase AlgX-related protein n=1 Tax=Solwaraspora sp. WMMB335 TaxID=3404118 RepID=UPI003B95A0B8